MMPPPRITGPYDDDAERSSCVEAGMGDGLRRSAIIVSGGCLALLLFGILAMFGLPGSGLILVPIGLGMILGGGIELVLGRIGG